MVESDVSFIKVTGHVGMYFPIDVVPLNGESNVFCCFFVHCHWIILSNRVDQMVRIFSIYIFHRKVVDHEAETNWSGFVFSQSIYNLALVITMLF